jgi:hypothetical protein
MGKRLPQAPGPRASTIMAKLTITEFAKYLGVSVCTVNKAHVAITGFPLVGLAHCQCRTQ